MKTDKERSKERKKKRKAAKQQKRERKKQSVESNDSNKKTKSRHESTEKSVQELTPKEEGKDADSNDHPYQPSLTASNENRHSFSTNVLDHCETPRAAYEHLGSFLEVVGKMLHKDIQPTKSVRIWDPFYCNGSMKTIFQDMGFHNDNIIHQNVDFYQLIRDQTIPDHDILVTNPPYSDDHIHRLLEFVVTDETAKARPSCLLLPNWVSRQPDYAQRFSDILEQQGHELLYLSPLQAYTYTMPTWVSEQDRPDHVGSSGKTTPYLSSWYLVIPKDLRSKNNSRRSVLDQMDALSKRQRPPLWVVAKTVKGLKWKIKKVNQRLNGNQK